MTTDFIALKTEHTVDQTIAVLRQEAREAENIYYLYVLDDPGTWSRVTLRSLIVASPSGSPTDEHPRDLRDDRRGQGRRRAFAKYRFCASCRDDERS
jgi:Mg/Co/Ni transporter MgtE